jgi:hypothetical protein
MLYEEMLARIEGFGGLGIQDTQICLLLDLPESAAADSRFRDAVQRGVSKKRYVVASALYAQAQNGKVDAAKLFLELSPDTPAAVDVLSAEERRERIREITKKLGLS